MLFLGFCCLLSICCTCRATNYIVLAGPLFDLKGPSEFVPVLPTALVDQWLPAFLLFLPAAFGPTTQLAVFAGNLPESLDPKALKPRLVTTSAEPTREVFQVAVLHGSNILNCFGLYNRQRIHATLTFDSARLITEKAGTPGLPRRSLPKREPLGRWRWPEEGPQQNLDKLSPRQLTTQQLQAEYDRLSHVPPGKLTPKERKRFESLRVELQRRADADDRELYTREAD